MCRLITIRAWPRAGRRTIGAHGGVISPADGAGVTAFVRTVLGRICRHRDFSNWGRSSADLSTADVPSLVVAAPKVVEVYEVLWEPTWETVGPGVHLDDFL